MQRTAPITGENSVIIQSRRSAWQLTVPRQYVAEVQKFSVRPPEKYAQYSVSVTVMFTMPQKRTSAHLTSCAKRHVRNRRARRSAALNPLI
jgi:hypothetical protein